MFDKDWFLNLEQEIRNLGADSDAQSFDEIRENLMHPRKLSPDAFADMCNYVILAGGFSQKTAKKSTDKLQNICIKMVRILMNFLECFIIKTKSMQYAKFGTTKTRYVPNITA